MGTVWVVNHIKDDVSRAAKYGDLKYVNLKYVYPDELETFNGDNWIPTAVRVSLRNTVTEFDPASDYLLIAGDHLQLVLFSAMLGRRRLRFRVLRWDRQAEGYVPVTIQL